MNLPIDLGVLRRRSLAHTVQDGLVDILTAAMLTIAAAAVTRPVALVLLPFVVLLGPRLLERLRARLSYPRAGYVEVTEEPSGRAGRRMLAYVGLAVGVFAAVIFLADDPTQASSWRRWSPLMAALIVGGGSYYIASTTGLRRYYVTQAVSLAAGVVLSIANTDRSYDAAAAFCVAMAGWSLLMGLVVFSRFVRAHPVPEPGETSDARG